MLPLTSFEATGCQRCVSSSHLNYFYTDNGTYGFTVLCLSESQPRKTREIPLHVKIQHFLVCTADMKTIQVDSFLNAFEGKIDGKPMKLREDGENFDIDFSCSGLIRVGKVPGNLIFLTMSPLKCVYTKLGFPLAPSPR